MTVPTMDDLFKLIFTTQPAGGWQGIKDRFFEGQAQSRQAMENWQPEDLVDIPPGIFGGPSLPRSLHYLYTGQEQAQNPVAEFLMDIFDMMVPQSPTDYGDMTGPLGKVGGAAAPLIAGPLKDIGDIFRRAKKIGDFSQLGEVFTKDIGLKTEIDRFLSELMIDSKHKLPLYQRDFESIYDTLSNMRNKSPKLVTHPDINSLRLGNQGLGLGSYEMTQGKASVSADAFGREPIPNNLWDRNAHKNVPALVTSHELTHAIDSGTSPRASDLWEDIFWKEGQFNPKKGLPFNIRDAVSPSEDLAITGSHFFNPSGLPDDPLVNRLNQRRVNEFQRILERFIRGKG
jgi:hypothetical protein